MAEPEIHAFLTHLAVKEKVCASTQNQALAALLFLYCHKYPNAPTEWRWQWIFPQENRWRNTKTGEEGRHHIDESLLQKAVKDVVTRAGLTKRATCHTFRHSFATHLFHIKRYDNNIILTGDVENIAIRPEMMPYSPASYTALNAVLRVFYGYI